MNQLIAVAEGKPLRVEARFRNNVLWHAIHDTYPSVAAFCRAASQDQTVVGALLNLKRCPYRKDGTPTKPADALAVLTGIGIEELFPAVLYQVDFPQRLVNELPLDAIPQRFLSTSGGIVETERRIAIERALITLRPRDQKALEMKFGLDGDSPQTDKEIGVHLGISKGRVAQILNHSFRCLRHPSRAPLLIEEAGE